MNDTDFAESNSSFASPAQPYICLFLLVLCAPSGFACSFWFCFVAFSFLVFCFSFALLREISASNPRKLLFRQVSFRFRHRLIAHEPRRLSTRSAAHDQPFAE